MGFFKPGKKYDCADFWFLIRVGIGQYHDHRFGLGFMLQNVHHNLADRWLDR
jgi:hypothetical protein